MKRKLLKALGLLILFALTSCGERKPSFVLNAEIEALSIPDAPAVNSYVHAVHDGQWLIIGGRTDGLHDHRPEYAYPKEFSNTNIWVIDPETAEVWKRPLDGLPVALFEQLQSTNMSFYQDGNSLTMVGGYGWSEAAGDYVTFPYLVRTDVAALFRAVKSGGDINNLIYQVENQDMAVSGGYLAKIDDQYYLVFGNRFDGRYTTISNKGHTQVYTNEIRKFRLKKQDGKTAIIPEGKIRDTAHFHRRDYNLLPQVFPDGTIGYTAFSGVFQYDRNFPWLYPVNITPNGYEAVESFQQQFSHYHSACVAVYRKQENQMDNLFFGGMARFVPDAESDEIKNDPLVPSVNTISQVSRFKDGTMNEAVLDIRMPGLLGASANFIPVKNIPLIKNKIVDFDRLPIGKTLIGYVYGGLESTHPNVFLQPKGESHSTNKIFRVYLIKE